MLIWMSDIHLNFLDENGRTEFYETVKNADGDKILITGDIAESHNVFIFLCNMAVHTGKSIYYVLGNHDYYGSSVKDVRKLARATKTVHWLPKFRNGVMVDEHTVLVGQDGWGDGRYGDFDHSRLTMSDWLYISELKAGYMNSREKLLKALQKIADLDAQNMAKAAYRACQRPNVTKVILASHVPPFEEACLYAGQKSTPSGLPFFASKIFGHYIMPIVENHPEIDFLWLCGHTHSGVTIERRDNFTVRVAEAQYYYPRIEALI